MAAPIGPGDWVECVDPREWASICPLGSVWLVEDTGEPAGFPALKLKGLVCPKSGCPWVLARWFRPIYRPKSDLIESLKAPPKRAPKRQREDA